MVGATPKSLDDDRQPGSHWLAGVLVGVLVAAAVLFRIYAIARVPGINADEAWYGVHAQRLAEAGFAAIRTPNGNAPGVMQLGELFLLHKIFPPSFELLRIPALLSSLGAMALAYAIGVRLGERQVGMVALVVMAVLPINIAYARMGWDPSHSGLLILFATYLALRDQRVLGALVFAAALTVHPTNVFAAPFVAITYFGHVAGQPDRERRVFAAGLFLAMLIVALTALAVTRVGGNVGTGTASVAERALDPAQWVLFAQLFLRLLSGDTAYLYFTGTGFGQWTPWIDAIGGILLIGLIVAGTFALRRDRLDARAGVVAGWLATVLMMFLFGGPDALIPHQERYGFVLVAPTAITLAVLASPMITTRKVFVWLAPLAGLILASFASHYFMAFERGAPAAHRAFRTGAQEPKAEAVEVVMASVRDRANGATLVVEDWWLYWPVRYLTHGRSVTVIDASASKRRSPDTNRHQQLVWLVYRNGPLDRALAHRSDASILWEGGGQQTSPQLRLWGRNEVPTRR